MRARLIKLITTWTVALLLVGCGSDAPGTDTPGTDTPGTDMPGTDTPASGASGDSAASPEVAIRGMLALAETGKWEQYVVTYYGEQHKMDDPGTQIAQVAARLEKVAAKLLETLRACADESPKISDDGTRAVYSNQFTLHKRDEKWGFHL